MNSPANHKNHRFTATRIRLPNFEIAWAGANRRSDGYCFGSEDGRLWFTGLTGVPETEPMQIVESGDAINGVAFTNNLVAASTRSEVSVWRVPYGLDQRSGHTVFPGGAHAIVATPSGRFVAPLGTGGLLIAEPHSGQAGQFRVARALAEPCNFYKVACLGSAISADVLCCALRESGIATVLYNNRGFLPGASYSNKGLDFIDVCPMRSNQMPFGAIALATDCSIHFVRDVRGDPQPQTRRFDVIRGTGYGLLSGRGHVFLLTSEGLYALLGLADRFVLGERTDEPTPIRHLELPAVDIFEANERTLLLLMPDCVYAIDMDSLAHEPAPPGSHQVSLPTANGVFDHGHHATIVNQGWERSDAFDLALA